MSDFVSLPLGAPRLWVMGILLHTRGEIHGSHCVWALESVLLDFGQWVVIGNLLLMMAMVDAISSDDGLLFGEQRCLESVHWQERYSCGSINVG